MAGATILGFCPFWLPQGFIPRSVPIYFLICLYVCVFGIRKVYDLFFQAHFVDKKALIIGTGPLAREIVSAIQRTPNVGIDIEGFVSVGEEHSEKKSEESQSLGVLKS